MLTSQCNTPRPHQSPLPCCNFSNSENYSPQLGRCQNKIDLKRGWICFYVYPEDKSKNIFKGKLQPLWVWKFDFYNFDFFSQKKKTKKKRHYKHTL